jgi:hypothetical protein
VAFLIGTWRGEGEGEWLEGEPFRYGEEMTFEDVGETYLAYAQRSWAVEGGAPLHLERGFLRPAGPARVELVLAHPLGVVEVAEGPLRDGAIELASTTVATTATGSPVTALRRRIEVFGNLLRYELHMATRGVPLARHLRGELRRE